MPSFQRYFPGYGELLAHRAELQRESRVIYRRGGKESQESGIPITRIPDGHLHGSGRGYVGIPRPWRCIGEHRLVEYDDVP